MSSDQYNCPNCGAELSYRTTKHNGVRTAVSFHHTVLSNADWAELADALFCRR